MKFIRLDNPAPAPTSLVIATAWSRDGRYLAVTHGNSPFVSVYKKTGLTLSKLGDPNLLPSGTTGNGVAWSPDGTHLFVAGSGTPRTRVYAFANDILTDLGVPALVTGNCFAAAYSPDGTHLAVGNSAAPYIRIYARSGNTYTEIAGIPPADNQVRSMAWSPDGSYLVVGLSVTPFLTFYKREGDSYTKLTAPTPAPTANTMAVGWSPDSTLVAVATNAAPGFILYERLGDSFLRFANPAVVPTTSGRAVRFLAGGSKLLVLTSATPPLTFIYDVGENQIITHDPTAENVSLEGMIYLSSSSWSNDGAFGSFGLSASPWFNGIYDEDTGSKVLFPTFTAEGSATVGAPTSASAELVFPSFGIAGLGTQNDEDLPLITPPITIETAFGAVDAFVPTISGDDPAYPYLYSWSRFPALGAAANVKMSATGTSDNTFPGFMTDGYFRWPLKLNGQIGLPAFRSSAEVEIDLIGVDGKLSFSAFTVSAEANVPTGITGQLGLPAFTAAGDGTIPIWTETDLRFPAFAAAGEVSVPLWVESALAFPVITSGGNVHVPIVVQGSARFSTFKIEGGLEYIIPPFYEVEGFAPFPGFRASSDGTIPTWIKSDARFPSPIVAGGSVEVPVAIYGAGSFPQFKADSFMSVPYRIDANTRFPRFTAAGFGGPPIKITGALPFPRFGMSMVTRWHFYLNASVSFPVFRVRGRDYQSMSVGGATLGGGDKNFIIGSGLTFGQAVSFKLG